MKVMKSFLVVLLISTSSFAETQSDWDTKKEIVKNVGTVLKECPTSYGAKVLIAVGETVPVLSAFTKIGHDLKETEKQIQALKKNENIADNSYSGGGRKFSSYLFGGIIATVYETVKQVGTGQLSSDEIQKAFADGYFVTRSETMGTKACVEAGQKIKQLIK
jgi:hypothetical protein